MFTKSSCIYPRMKACEARRRRSRDERVWHCFGFLKVSQILAIAFEQSAQISMGLGRHGVEGELREHP